MSDHVVHDQLFRQRYSFSREGGVLRIDIWSDPGGGVLAEHIHPTIEERYEVLEGRLTVHADGQARVLGPGERAVVPPGVRHRFENTGEGESHVRVEAEPAELLRESIEEGRPSAVAATSALMASRGAPAPWSLPPRSLTATARPWS